MPWHDDYRRKCCSAQDAVRLINNGDRLFTSGNVATPRVLLRALVERRQELEHVELVHLLLMGDEFSLPGAGGDVPDCPRAETRRGCGHNPW
jgi:4-hydroxybutyrate CoA-transferase